MSLRKRIAEWIYPPFLLVHTYQDHIGFIAKAYEDGYNAHKKEIADSYSTGLNEGINVGLRTAALNTKRKYVKKSKA